MTDDNDTPEHKSWLNRISQAFHHEPQNKAELSETLTHAAENNLIDEEALTMINGVMNVSNLTAEDIMIPRSQMIVLELGMPIQAVLPIVIDSAHSRFPVIGENKDDVVGILLAKDLLRFFHENTSVKEALLDGALLRPAGFIPESKRLDSLLKEFRSSRDHMAIVVDEYGGVSGVVTIEDVLEEIVGDIEDEFDVEEDTNIKRVSDGLFIVQAITDIAEFNTAFGAKFSNETVDTLGGLVTQQFGHVPKQGEVTTVDQFEFTILEADSRRVQRIEVKLL